ncbi:hypothetical protein [Synechococcus sp. MU1642]|uniref:hypothetical protein n=1 Tax=Synechococcus sp. MU1642 TaxID=2508348 RepID=UPI001CF821D1|nr:hypothetical protein [Synechococcus sp. MU1642]
MLFWQLFSRNQRISDPENASSPNEALSAVNQAKNPQRESQQPDVRQESGKKLWKNKSFCCDHCRQPGSVHFRVSTEGLADWILVCKTCWPNFQEQAGYRYGGTRKANRRKRKLQ